MTPHSTCSTSIIIRLESLVCTCFYYVFTGFQTSFFSTHRHRYQHITTIAAQVWWMGSHFGSKGGNLGFLWIRCKRLCRLCSFMFHDHGMFFDVLWYVPGHGTWCFSSPKPQSRWACGDTALRMVGTWTSGAGTQRRIDPNAGFCPFLVEFISWFQLFTHITWRTSIPIQAPVSLQVGLGADVHTWGQNQTSTEQDRWTV